MKPKNVTVHDINKQLCHVQSYQQPMQIIFYLPCVAKKSVPN